MFEQTKLTIILKVFASTWHFFFRNFYIADNRKLWRLTMNTAIIIVCGMFMIGCYAATVILTIRSMKKQENN